MECVAVRQGTVSVLSGPDSRGGPSIRPRQCDQPSPTSLSSAWAIPLLHAAAVQLQNSLFGATRTCLAKYVWHHVRTLARLQNFASLNHRTIRACLPDGVVQGQKSRDLVWYCGDRLLFDHCGGFNGDVGREKGDTHQEEHAGTRSQSRGDSVGQLLEMW